jgi:hypothetical protein
MKKIHIKLIPAYIGLFVWHLRCLYELKIVNPLWFIFPLPKDPYVRVWSIIGIYLFILINYIWYKYNDKPEGFIIVPLYLAVSVIYLAIFKLL